MKMKEKIEFLENKVDELQTSIDNKEDQINDLEEQVEILRNVSWEEFTTANGNIVKVQVDNPVDELLIKDFFECMRICTPAQMEHNLSVIKQFKTVI